MPIPHLNTPEVKRKRSQSLKGNKNGLGHRKSPEAIERIRQAHIGNRNGMFGKTHSPKTRRGISDRTKDERNPAWKGGNDKWFKRRVLKRDDYTCQKCGMKDEVIVILDHIKPKSIYPELRFEMTNLQTLCPNCHARKTNAEKIEIIRIKRARINL